MRRALIDLLLVGCAALGCLLLAGCARDNSAPAAASPAGKPAAPSGGSGFAPPPVPVEVTTVQSRNVDYSLSAVGSLEAREIVRIPARVAGVIESLNFQEGEKVTPAKVLARIDPERYRLAAQRAEADYRQAEAQAREAEAALDKRHALREKDPGWVTAEELSNFQAQLERAQAAVASAKAQWDLARKDARDSEVRAETAGYIDDKLADTGQYLTAGTPVATMVDARRLKLTFRVSESEALRLTPDSKVSFKIRGLPGREFPAKLYHLGQIADPGTRMVQCLAWAENETGELRPGSFADVAIHLEDRKASVVVPQTAVLPTDRGFVGYILKGDDRVERRQLKLGLFTKEGDVEVLEGLSLGDRVITRGASILTEDSVVKPTAPEKTP